MPSANPRLRVPVKKQRVRKARIGSQPERSGAEKRLAVGDHVVIFAMSASGPSIEGTAVISSPSPASDRYRVRFDGDPTIRLRFVNPDWQACPERSLTLLREFWRLYHHDDPVIENFFPDIDSAL